MKSRVNIAALALMVSAGMFSANAQTQPQPPVQDGGAAAPIPAQPPVPGQGPRFGREGGGRGGGMMMGPRGMGQGSMGQGMSDADRTAFFEARLASIKAGLLLNETQQRLWPAVEAAIRDSRKQREDMRERIRKEGQPANPVDRMKRAGEMMSARGAITTKMAEAMKPLHDSLSDDQKRRLQTLMRGNAGQGRQGMGGQRGRFQEGGRGPNMRGEFQQRWRQGMGPDGQDRRGQGGPQGEGRRWRQDAPDNEPNRGGGREDWRRM